MNGPTPFEDRLRRELVAAIAARRSARSWPVGRIVLAAATTAAAVVLVLVAWPGWFGPAPALAVTRKDGTVVIDLHNPDASLPALRRELASAGVDAEVRRIPVSPSMVGRWIGALLPDGRPADTKDHRPSPHELGTSRIVLRFEPNSHVVLFLGKSADRGERYLVSANAFRPGEALSCSGIGGLDSARAAQALTGRGLSVRWFSVPTVGQPPSVLEPATAVPPGTVSGAEMESSTTVRVSVTPPGQPAPAPDANIDRVDLVLHQLLTGADPADVPINGRMSLTIAGSTC